MLLTSEQQQTMTQAEAQKRVAIKRQLRQKGVQFENTEVTSLLQSKLAQASV